MHHTYGELEAFLAEIHRVAPEKRTALKGRLKHFQRLGWPAGTNQGKGARVQYGVGQTLSLAIGFELLQLGLTPERVVDQMKYAGGYLVDGFLECLDQTVSEPDPVYYIFAPESLHSFRGEEGEGPGFSSMLLSRSQVQEMLSSAPLFHQRRFAFIDMLAVLDAYLEYFKNEGAIASREQLREPLLNWQKLRREARDRYFEKLEEWASGNQEA